MTKRLTRAERRAATVAAKQGGAVMDRAIGDSFQNVAAGLGIGTDNVSSGARYAFNPITRSRQDLEYMYRGSWIVGQAVDCVAEDMVRAGIDIKGTVAPDQVENIHAGLTDLQIWEALGSVIKWSRLYGGAVGILLIEGQDMSKPLRPETVTKGQFRGVYVLDRWSVQPNYGRPIKSFGPDMGKPSEYRVVVDAPALNGEVIHHSRIIRFDGIELPYWQRAAEQGWGMSVVERLYDRLVAFDSTTQGAAQLVYKAHLRTVKVKDLRGILAAGGAAEAALTKQFQMIRSMQSNEGLTLLDAEDDFQTYTYTFSGLSDVMMQFAQQISGALQIPLVRLFGQSPAGLNSTGDSDIRSYYDLIAQQQRTRLHHPVSVIVDLIYRSKFGAEPPADLAVEFNSLWQMSDKEKAEIAVGVTAAVSQAYGDGIVSKPAALKELRQSADVTGVWSNITDEDIEEAEDEPPPPEMGNDDGTSDPLGLLGGLTPEIGQETADQA